MGLSLSITELQDLNIRIQGLNSDEVYCFNEMGQANNYTEDLVRVYPTTPIKGKVHLDKVRRIYAACQSIDKHSRWELFKMSNRFHNIVGIVPPPPPPPGGEG